jgi:phosphatidylglycerophosphate synthase
MSAWLASGGAVLAVAVAMWAELDRRPRLAGAFVLAAGASSVVGGAFARRSGVILDRILDSFADRAFDGCVLGAIAWAARGESGSVAAAAVVALCLSFLGAYMRARGVSLGYRVQENLGMRGLRYGLISAGLLSGWLQQTLWALAILMLLCTAVRASQVAKEERT